MKKFLVAIFALLVGTSAYAAGTGMYFGVDVSYDIMTFDLKAGGDVDRNNIGVGLAIGKAFPAVNGDIRPEIAFTYALEDDDYSYYQGMLNLYYDIEITKGVYVYPTVGVGMRFHSLDDSDDESFTGRLVQV